MEKFTEHIRDILKERGNADTDIAAMTPDEAFREVLEREGIIGYDGVIKRWIKAIYGIEVEAKQDLKTEEKTAYTAKNYKVVCCFGKPTPLYKVIDTEGHVVKEFKSQVEATMWISRQNKH